MVTRALTALRNELEARELIRRPGVAGPLPPLFVEPAGGPPAPGEREGSEAGTNLAVTLRLSGEVAPGTATGYRRILIVDLVYRSRETAGLKAGRDLDAAIRAGLLDGVTYGTGVRLDEAGPADTVILELSVFAGLSPVSELGGVRTEQSKLSLELLAA